MPMSDKPNKAIDESNLDRHALGFPDPKNCFSLFQNDWQHFKLETEDGNTSLSVERLNDQFIPFCAERIGGFGSKRVLELGPYEGFHSFALARAGVALATSIEANPRNFLKCLIVKNYFSLDRISFLLGDFATYLKETKDNYDFVLAAGVLYHLSRPFEVLDRIMELTDSIGICTTYYDEEHKKFEFTGQTREYTIPGHEPFILHERPNATGTKRRKQGIDAHAWMFSRADLLRFLEARNFKYEIRDQPVRSHLGPRIQLYAHR